MTVAEQGDMSQSMIFSSANCSFGNSRDSAGLPHSRPFRIRHDCVEGEHGGSLPFCFADTLIPATDAVSDTADTMSDTADGASDTTSDDAVSAPAPK